MKNEKEPAKPKAGVVLAEGRVRVKALNQGRALYVRRAKKEKPMWLEQDPMDCRTHQAPRSMEFSRQEYWSALPCPPPGDLPNAGIEPTSLTCLLHWQACSLPLVPPGKP